MKKPQFIDDKGNHSKLITFSCYCGCHAAVDVGHGPVRVTLECPNLDCRRMFELEYVGRRHVAEPAPIVPTLRLVQ